MLHLHDDRSSACDQRAAGFGPQPGIRQAEPIDAGFNLGEIRTKRWRRDVRISDREPAAHVNDVDANAGLANDIANQGQRTAPSERIEALRSDMKAQPKTRRVPRTEMCRPSTLMCTSSRRTPARSNLTSQPYFVR